MSKFTVTGNSFSVIDAPPLGVAYKYFPAFRHANGAIYNLTPNSEWQIYAVRLLRQSMKVIGNQFTNNKMIAECRPGGSCAGGVGLFVAPGVGGATPDTFTDNTIIGAGVPAVRCGKDRYERNRLCHRSAADGSCASAAEAEKSSAVPQANDLF